MPTVCEITGAEIPEDTDGISYLPSLTGKGHQKKHDFLYYEFHEKGGKRAIIRNGWKLVELDSKTPEKAYYELYNLEKDESETENVISSHPRLAKKLKKLMDSSRTANPIWDFDGFGSL